MSKQPTLYSFPSTAELAPVLRRYILQAQASALSRHHFFSVAVSGGSLPATLAKALLGGSEASSDASFNVKADVIHWSKWRIFYADERCVPLDHPESNHALIMKELVNKIPSHDPEGIPEVFPIDAKLINQPAECADAYEKSLISHFAAKDSVRLPVFDLLLLGNGPDGHCCSLFPGHELLREEDAWVGSLEDSPKPPLARVTLTLPVVTHALRIAFVSTGAGKRDILRKVFDGEEGARELPIGIINEKAGDRVAWFCDDAAVEGIRFPKKSNL